MDSRLKAARDYLAGENKQPGALLLADLLDYAEERLRVNVGLVNQQKEKQPPTEVKKPDLSEVSSLELLAELQRRLDR